jgi:hypothetical protein
VIRSRPRPLAALLVVLAAVAAVLVGLVSPAAAAAPYCGITWGSQPKAHTAPSPAGLFVYNVRAGRHACYDRLVIDIGEAGGFDGFDVRYVPQVVEDPSGAAVPVRGGAALQVVAWAPNTFDEHVTYLPRNPAEVVGVGGFRTFRQVAWAGSFEGYTSLGLGVRARLPFRAFTVTGPEGSGLDMRLVIDVAHRW